jgi:virginiamycin B lyase
MFPLPTGHYPGGIAVGPTGEVWFTDGFTAAPAIGRLAADGTMTRFPLPTVDSNPMGPAGGSAPSDITLGPDGNMWFLEAGADQIGRITADGVITEFPLPGRESMHVLPAGIAAGPDGAVWFTESLGSKVSRIDSVSGAIKEFSVTRGSNKVGPGTLTLGSDGALWFDVGLEGIGRMNTSGSAKTFPTVTGASWFWSVTSGPDGFVWFLDDQARVMRISPEGAVSQVAKLPTAFLNPDARMASAGNAVWITESHANHLVRIICG